MYRATNLLLFPGLFPFLHAMYDTNSTVWVRMFKMALNHLYSSNIDDILPQSHHLSSIYIYFPLHSFIILLIPLIHALLFLHPLNYHMVTYSLPFLLFVTALMAIFLLILSIV